MQPWETLARAATPDGTELVLARRGEEYVVRAGGHVLMSSRQHESEDRLGAAGCARLAPGARVLVGGLGLGYTLRAALQAAPRDSEITVSELVPALVSWNHGALGPLAGRPLDDPRVRVETGDVRALVGRTKATWDAILLDVDNGPSALVTPANARIYGPKGLDALAAALRPGGVVSVWSAGPDPAFERRAVQVGFAVQTEEAPARTRGKGPRHVLFLLAKPRR